MQPTIRDGAEVTLLCVDDVVVGDVVAYVYGDRVIVHRLVAKWGDRFVARGDANFLPDGLLLDRSDVIGKVVGAAAAPASPFASLFLRTIGVAGPRSALRVVGVLRMLHRRMRISPAPQ